jgi:aryl-alcohol dehydrogenase-like predicted oxidoreductase
MQMRVFGRTGMQLSVLGFGCGAVGGLMVRGDPADQERTVARAVAAGVNYFDTAVLYGDGESESNLGRVLQKLKPAGVAVGTKVRIPPGAVALPTPLRLRSKAVWRDCGSSASISFICTIRLPRRAAVRR